MHAYLFIGSKNITQKEGQKTISDFLNIDGDYKNLKKVPDYSEVDFKKLKKLKREGNKKIKFIDKIKEVSYFLNLKPKQKDGRGVLVSDFHLVSNAAQNAFLKTLEEPRSDSCIVITAKTTKDILPTILSRVNVSYLEEKEGDIESIMKWKEFKDLNDGERVKRVESLSDLEKNKLENQIESWFYEIKNNIKEEDPETIKFLGSLYQDVVHGRPIWKRKFSLLPIKIN